MGPRMSRMLSIVPADRHCLLILSVCIYVPKKSKPKQTLKTDDDDEQVGDYDIATVDVPIQNDDDMDDDDQEKRAVEGDDGQSNEEEQAEGEGDDGQNIEEEQGEGEADDGHVMMELQLDQGATSDQEESATE